MDNNDNIVMSRYAFERMQSKDERNDRWRNIIIVMLIILLVVTNAMWLVAWNQYDYVDDFVSAEQYGEGINIIGQGDVNYGPEDNTQAQDEDTP